MKFEAEIINFLQANASTGWITFFQFITTFGSYLGFFVAFIIIFLKNKKLGITFAITFALASVCNYFIKHIIKRDRPFVTYEYIENYGGEDGFSMPSGHSMCAGLFATFLLYHLFTQTKKLSLRISGAIFLSLFTGLIAFSRMVLGVHYLTDIIFGIIVGIIFAIIGICLYNYVRKRDVSID